MSGFVCPYLGRADDRETAFAFSSPGHRCFRLKEPSPITLSHQSSYCLSNEYTRCPVFTLASMLEPDEENSNRVPGTALQSEESHLVELKSAKPTILDSFGKWYNGIINSIQQLASRIFKTSPDQNPVIPAILLMASGILVIVLLFFGVVAVSYLSTTHEPQPTPDLRMTALAEVQPEIFLVTVTPTMRSAFIQKMGMADILSGSLLAPVDTPQPEPTPITIVVTSTFEPTQTAASYFACGAPSDWVSYIVQQGDSLSELAASYDVPLWQLSSYNCLNTDSSLYIGQQLYLPPR